MPFSIWEKADSTAGLAAECVDARVKLPSLTRTLSRVFKSGLATSGGRGGHMIRRARGQFAERFARIMAMCSKAMEKRMLTFGATVRSLDSLFITVGVSRALSGYQGPSFSDGECGSCR